MPRCHVEADQLGGRGEQGLPQGSGCLAGVEERRTVRGSYLPEDGPGIEDRHQPEGAGATGEDDGLARVEGLPVERRWASQSERVAGDRQCQGDHGVDQTAYEAGKIEEGRRCVPSRPSDHEVRRVIGADLAGEVIGGDRPGQAGSEPETQRRTARKGHAMRVVSL